MKTENNTMNFWGALRFINPFLNRLRLPLILFYFGWLFDTLAAILSPILFGIMINQMVYYRNLPLFIQISLAFFALSVFSCVQYYLYCLIWNKLIYRMRCRMFSAVQKMDAQAMTDANYGDMAQLMQWQVMECVHFIVRNVVHNIPASGSVWCRFPYLSPTGTGKKYAMSAAATKRPTAPISAGSTRCSTPFATSGCSAQSAGSTAFFTNTRIR